MRSNDLLTIDHHCQIDKPTDEQITAMQRYGTKDGSPEMVDGELVVNGFRLRLLGHVPIHDRIWSHRLSNRGGVWRIEYKLLPDIRPLEPTGEAVGIDPGLQHIITTSKGLHVAPHPDIVRIDKMVHRLGADLADKSPGSVRHRELTRRIARLEQRRDDIQLDQFNQIADQLCKHNDIIAIEDCDVETGAMHNEEYLAAGRRARWDLLKHVIEFRCVETGRTFVLSPRFWSSQTCSECRWYVPKKVSERWHKCPKCGYEADRDVNGAREILNRAMEILDGSTRTDHHPIGHPHYVMQ